MRVTDLTKQHSILRNIANNADKMQNLQEGMASGKRIHRLSDDPIGATQVQDYRTSLSYMDATKRNINSDFVWLDRYEAELAHMADLMKEAKSLVLAQANDSADEATRRLTGKEIQAIIDGMVNSGNSMNGKLFMFSGTQTYTRPLETNPETQTALVGLEPSGGPVVLDGFQADFRGYSTHPYILRVTHPGPLGQARYAVSDDNGETWSKENTLLTSNEMVNPKGQPSDKVTLRMTGPQKNAEGGPLEYPEGLTFTFAPNPPIAYRGNDEKRMVPTGEGTLVPLNLTGREVFFHNDALPESVDIFSLLFAVKRGLETNDPEVLRNRLDDLDHAHEQLLLKRAEVGGTRKEMDAHLEKLTDQEGTKTQQMSDLEDLDFAEAAVEMNLADIRHKASLDTGSRLVQPSLLNFLK